MENSELLDEVGDDAGCIGAAREAKDEDLVAFLVVGGQEVVGVEDVVVYAGSSTT